MWGIGIKAGGKARAVKHAKTSKTSKKQYAELFSYPRHNCFRCSHQRRRPCSVDCSPAPVLVQLPPLAAVIAQQQRQRKQCVLIKSF